MAQRFRTDFKDEIVQGGTKLWNAVSETGTKLVEKFRMERANGNTQEGSNFGAKEANAIHTFLNGLLDGTETVSKASKANDVANVLNKLLVGSKDNPNRSIEFYSGDGTYYQLHSNGGKFWIHKFNASGNVLRFGLEIDADGICTVDKAIMSDDTKKMSALGYGDALPFSDNALNIDLSGTRNGKLERVNSYSETTKNCPLNNFIGTKVQYVISIQCASVVLYEIYPVSGRIWRNDYNTTWQGWKNVSDGGNANTVDGFGFNNKSATGTPTYVPGWGGGSTPANMDMYKPSAWTVGNANLLMGAKLLCQTYVINLAGQTTKVISYPSDFKTIISVMAVNSNCYANYSYVQSYSTNSDGLHLRFNEVNGNNLQVNIWWYYIPK